MPDERKVIDPTTGETEHADEVIRELQEVLTKHNYVLISKPHAMVLAKIVNLGAMQCKAIAEIQHITPRKITARTFDWTPEALARPVRNQ